MFPNSRMSLFVGCLTSHHHASAIPNDSNTLLTTGPGVLLSILSHHCYARHVSFGGFLSFLSFVLFYFALQEPSRRRRKKRWRKSCLAVVMAWRRSRGGSSHSSSSRREAAAEVVVMVGAVEVLVAAATSAVTAKTVYSPRRVNPALSFSVVRATFWGYVPLVWADKQQLW